MSLKLEFTYRYPMSEWDIREWDTYPITCGNGFDLNFGYILLYQRYRCILGVTVDLKECYGLFYKVLRSLIFLFKIAIIVLMFVKLWL